MNNKKRFIWILVISIIILAVAAVTVPTVLAISGYRNYQEKVEIEVAKFATPEEVTQDFYTWYLDYFGNPAEGTFRSPLADRAYQGSEYLTPSFIGHVDEVLADFGNQGGYDPFLCAQDIPQEVRVDGTFWHGEQASVILRTSFPNHFMTADLYKSRETWKIGNITCGFSPDGTAKAFYTWYLAYIGDPSSDEMRNPLLAGAYRESGFLSAEFIQELDVLGTDGIPVDPILMAQDIPQDFSVDPGTETGTAIVHLQFGSDSVRHLKVSLTENDGGWMISGISPAE
jgi:hypothetical protein